MSVAELQELALNLKVELRDCEEEVRKYKQRCMHLEGDFQNKANWFSQSQQALKSAQATKTATAAPNWALRRAFVDRGALELKKTHRLLGRPVSESTSQGGAARIADVEDGASLESLRSTKVDLQSELDRATEMVRDMEAQVQKEEADLEKQRNTIRRKLQNDSRRRTKAELERLRVQLSARQQEESLLEAAAVNRQKLMRSVTAEVQEVRRKMEESTQHRYKQRVMQAVTDKDSVAARLAAVLQEGQHREEERHKQHTQERARLEAEAEQAWASVQEDKATSDSLLPQIQAAELAEADHARELVAKREATREAARTAKAEAQEFKRRRAAAMRIQKVQRGRKGRRRAEAVRQSKRRKRAAVCIQSHVRGQAGRRYAAQVRHERRCHAATQIQRFRRGQLARREAAERLRQKREAAAVHIQRLGRGLLSRKEAARRREAKRRLLAILQLQSASRAWLARQELFQKAQHSAAVAIQRRQRGRVGRKEADSRRSQRLAETELLRGDSFQTTSHISDCPSSVCGPHLAAVTVHEAEDGPAAHIELRHDAAAQQARSPTLRVERRSPTSAAPQAMDISQEISAMLDVNTLLGKRPESEDGPVLIHQTPREESIVEATSSTDADPISEWTADANREEPSALNPPVAEVGAQKLQVASSGDPPASCFQEKAANLEEPSASDAAEVGEKEVQVADRGQSPVSAPLPQEAAEQPAQANLTLATKEPFPGVEALAEASAPVPQQVTPALNEEDDGDDLEMFEDNLSVHDSMSGSDAGW